MANRNKIQQAIRVRRAARVRARVRGSAERPRMSVFRSLKHLRVQLIDDVRKLTLAAASDEGGKGTKTERATLVGKAIAEKAKALGIQAVVFDRGSYRYHGRVKALADAARAEGLNF